MTLPDEISVAELARMRERADAFILLDVREPDEVATASLAGATLVPMAEIPARAGELSRESPIVVMCHGGYRSARVAQYLRANGFANVANLAGGIDAWSAEIDPAVPRY